MEAFTFFFLNSQNSNFFSVIIVSIENFTLFYVAFPYPTPSLEK